MKTDNKFITWLKRYFITWVKKNKVLLILTLALMCLNGAYYPISVPFVKKFIVSEGTSLESLKHNIEFSRTLFFVITFVLYLFSVFVICLNKVKIKPKELKVLFIVLTFVNTVLFLLIVYSCIITFRGDLLLTAYSVLITQFTPTILSVLVYYVARGVIEHRKQETKTESDTVFINKQSISTQIDKEQ